MNDYELLKNRNIILSGPRRVRKKTQKNAFKWGDEDSNMMKILSIAELNCPH